MLALTLLLGTGWAQPCAERVAPALAGAALDDDLAHALLDCGGEPSIATAIGRAVAAGEVHPTLLVWGPTLRWWADQPGVLEAVAEAAVAAPTGEAAASLGAWIRDNSDDAPFLTLDALTILATRSCECGGGPGGYALYSGALVLRPPADAGEWRVEALAPGDRARVQQVLCGCGGRRLWVDGTEESAQRRAVSQQVKDGRAR